MRIPKPWVPILAKHIMGSLASKEMVRPLVQEDKLLAVTEEVLMDELMVEDRLNDEIRELLKRHESDIEKGRMDYRKLFEMTKQKLVRERNIVL